MDVGLVRHFGFDWCIFTWLRVRAFSIDFRLLRHNYTRRDTNGGQLATCGHRHRLDEIRTVASNSVGVHHSNFLHLLATVTNRPAGRHVAYTDKFYAVRVFPNRHTRARTQVNRRFSPFVLTSFYRACFGATIWRAMEILGNSGAQRVIFIHRVRMTRCTGYDFIQRTSVAGFSHTLMLYRYIRHVRRQGHEHEVHPTVARFTRTINQTLQPIRLVGVRMVDL